MLRLASTTVSVFPLLVRCAPWNVHPGPHRRQDFAITETVMSTYTESSTMTTYTTVISTGSVVTPASTPTSASEALPVFVLPPAFLPSAIIGLAPASSSSFAGPSSTASEPAPSASETVPQQQMMAYYPDWAAPAFPPEKIDFGRFDWIDFAFAVPDQNYNLTWDSSDDSSGLLTRLVTAAHHSGKKVKLSVGGWGGSKYFSTAVSNSVNRQTLVDNILAYHQQFDLDGIDIDWEYPGQDGSDGNNVDPDDSANFLSFLQLLRSTLPSTSKISAAVQTVPFADSQGSPMTDVSAFAQVLDWVLLMNYDSWGSSATPGPNAPLSDGCHDSTQSSDNAVAALNAWTSAGFPASQLVLGVPSYGYISHSNATKLRTRSQSWHSWRRRLRRSLLGFTKAVVAGVEADASPAIKATNEDGGTTNGQIQFRDLVREGILQYAPEDADSNTSTSTGAPTRMVVNGRQFNSLYDGWSGFSRYWDNCSTTPFLQSPAADQVVTYDDPLSLGLKAAFAQQSGMLGVNMFDVTGDTDQWDLTDALRNGLGLG